MSLDPEAVEFVLVLPIVADGHRRGALRMAGTIQHSAVARTRVNKVYPLPVGSARGGTYLLLNYKAAKEASDLLPTDGVLRERTARLSYRIRPFGGVDVAVSVDATPSPAAP